MSLNYRVQKNSAKLSGCAFYKKNSLSEKSIFCDDVKFTQNNIQDIILIKFDNYVIEFNDST